MIVPNKVHMDPGGMISNHHQVMIIGGGVKRLNNGIQTFQTSFQPQNSSILTKDSEINLDSRMTQIHTSGNTRDSTITILEASDEDMSSK